MLLGYFYRPYNREQLHRALHLSLVTRRHLAWWSESGGEIAGGPLG
jgi:hypothetical protein